MPVASIALDLFLGDQPDPMLEEIYSKLDSLSAKVDTYHTETMSAFTRLEAAVCEASMAPSRATLENMNDFV